MDRTDIMLLPFTKKGQTDTEIRLLLYFIKQSPVSPLIYIHSAMMNLKLFFCLLRAGSQVTIPNEHIDAYNVAGKFSFYVGSLKMKKYQGYTKHLDIKLVEPRLKGISREICDAE
jgi:hypothetical protein